MVSFTPSSSSGKLVNPWWCAKCERNRPAFLHVTWEKPFDVAAEWKSRRLQHNREPVATDVNWLLVTLLEYCSNAAAS